VSANLIWNVSNTPASEISMLGKITGLTFAPVAACATFGVTLKLAIDAIRRKEAKLVVIGATDPPPQPVAVAAFYKARVLSADGKISNPLSGLRGTHVSGGSVVWIVGDFDYMAQKCYRPLGLEPLSVGVNADAEHIITPSKEGPKTAIHQAFELAKIHPEEIALWDVHATATPGDYLEIETLKQIVPSKVLVTSRKGTFGHGMSAGGGWELTAQYLGYEEGQVFPTPLKKKDLNAEIAHIHENFVFDSACQTPHGIVGKLSMGVGGINACVLSRPWHSS
jgi:3-oxoacyl-(acyl-carrier-protein) synthase